MSNFNPADHDRGKSGAGNTQSFTARYRNPGKDLAVSPWSGFAEGDSSIWEYTQIPDDAIDSLEITRTDEVRADGFQVTAMAEIDLDQIAHFKPVGYLLRHHDNIDAWLAEQYDPSVHLAVGHSADTVDLTFVEFTAGTANLVDGETFPNDVEGLTAFASEKTQIHQLHADLRGGLRLGIRGFYGSLSYRLDQIDGTVSELDKEINLMELQAANARTCREADEAAVAERHQNTGHFPAQRLSEPEPSQKLTFEPLD